MEILVRVLPNIKHALKKLTLYAVSTTKRYTINYQKSKIKIVKCLVTNRVFFNIYTSVIKPKPNQLITGPISNCIVKPKPIEVQ